MRGYEVVTSDKRRVGRVVDVTDGYLIVRSGRLSRSSRPIPREFVHAVDDAELVVVTVPRQVLRDAPRLDRRGVFDAQGAARHYGLAESYLRPQDNGLAGAPFARADRDSIAARGARPKAGSPKG